MLMDFITTIDASMRSHAARMAVEGPEFNLTFAQLGELSAKLANRLQAQGIGPGSRVAIALPRGARELVAMLAIARTGGTYVPLDLSHPIERLSMIIEDAEPHVIILLRGTPIASHVPPATIPMPLDDIEGLLKDEEATFKAPHYDPRSILYILFTSGSTGRPKGVEVPRGAFTNFLTSMAHTPGLSVGDRLFAVTTTTFDISGLELFLPLCVGATVVIADSETTRDPRLLRRRLQGDNITVMQATPASWRMLIEAGWIGSPDLKILCGGEAMSPALADQLVARCGELWNMYGPTETTVWSTVARIEKGYDRITIGTAIDNTTLYVLDEDLKEVPVGSEGELLIGGDGLAAGYRGMPELTARKFVQNPFGPPGDRLYRTGDLARKLADGRFQCLGRLDHQVKIRGFRIELGEIEAAMRSAGNVGEALVVAEPVPEGDPMLVAYWTGTATEQDVAAAVKRLVPDYMQPRTYVPIEQFPLNTNGKIDRARLPKADARRHVALVGGTQARDDIELRVANVWKRVLRLPEVPVDVTFLDLGGTSLQAAQVVVQLEKEFDTEIPVRTVFEHPTVEELAKALVAGGLKDGPAVVKLREGSSGSPSLFCLLGVHLYQELARAIEADVTVFGVHVPMTYEAGGPPPTLAEISQRYAEVVRLHAPQGPYHLLGFCNGGVVAWEVGRRLESEGHPVAGVTILDAFLPTALKASARKQLLRVAQTLRAGDPAGLNEILNKFTAKLSRKAGFASEASAAQSPQRAGTAKRVDFAIEGPLFDPELAAIAAGHRTIAAPLLVVRATEEMHFKTREVDPDYGWRPHALQLSVKDMAATHVALLQGARARELATLVVGHHRLDAQRVREATVLPKAG